MVRYVGLYHARRGAHTYFLKLGEVCPSTTAVSGTGSPPDVSALTCHGPDPGCSEGSASLWPQVPRWGGYTVNLIHYEDAASMAVAVGSRLPFVGFENPFPPQLST